MTKQELIQAATVGAFQNKKNRMSGTLSDWSVEAMTLDEWIEELKYGDLDSIKDRLDAMEIVDFLEELKERREREDKELAERSLEIERDDWEREG